MECFYNARPESGYQPIIFIPHQKKAILINESNKSFTDKSARKLLPRILLEGTHRGYTLRKIVISEG